MDPLTVSASTWVMLPPLTSRGLRGALDDLKSGAAATGSDGSAVATCLVTATLPKRAGFSAALAVFANAGRYREWTIDFGGLAPGCTPGDTGRIGGGGAA